MVGLGFQRSKAKAIVECFEWDESELDALKELKMPHRKDTLLDRQYKHICYLGETAFALAIELRKNVSGNPTCEWQLGWFGDDSR